MYHEHQLGHAIRILELSHAQRWRQTSRMRIHRMTPSLYALSINRVVRRPRRSHLAAYENHSAAKHGIFYGRGSFNSSFVLTQLFGLRTHYLVVH